MSDIVAKDQQQAAGERVLAMIRKEFPEYHPILAIARLAHGEESKEDLRLQLECHKTIVKYVQPELKSVEVRAEIKETRRVIVSLFDGETPGDTFDATSPTPQISTELDPLWKRLDVSDAELLERVA